MPGHIHCIHTVFVLSAPVSVYVVPNVLCSVCADYAMYTAVCAEHLSLRYLLLHVCCATVVTHRGLMCLLLTWPASVVAYRLCHVISAPLSGDPRLTCWLSVQCFLHIPSQFTYCSLAAWCTTTWMCSLPVCCVSMLDLGVLATFVCCVMCPVHCFLDFCIGHKLYFLGSVVHVVYEAVLQSAWMCLTV